MEILEIGYLAGATATASPTVVRCRQWIESETGAGAGYWIYVDLR